MQVQQLWGVSTRVVMWIAGDQEVGIDATGVGTEMARVTVSWEVAQIHFTAADQVASLAAQMRDTTGVSAVLPPRVHTRSIHGRPDQIGPLPVALVTFTEPRTVRVVPGSTILDGGQVVRWADVSTGYLLLRVVDRVGWTSLTTALNRAETVAEVALPAHSAGHRTPAETR